MSGRIFRWLAVKGGVGCSGLLWITGGESANKLMNLGYAAIYNLLLSSISALLQFSSFLTLSINILFSNKIHTIFSILLNFIYSICSLLLISPL
jgi:hypothetical protein